ncbi:MAG: CBS domain-containing protein [Candidatus Omnitrophota bacterium]|jgi:CBS domain-containing protein|nr:MAG: CBS domain-containing protein [Candidatus Omnitrophota bacterium]
MKIKEIMVKDVKSIAPDSTALEAMNLLYQLEISGLPVIDKNNKLVGMFTEKNILSFLLPSYIEKVGRFIYEDNPKATKKKLNELATVKVAQLMRSDVITVRQDAALCEVARLMLTQKVRRVPVVDNSGSVVGIVARCDVLKAMFRMAGE